MKKMRQKKSIPIPNCLDRNEIERDGKKNLIIFDVLQYVLRIHNMKINRFGLQYEYAENVSNEAALNTVSKKQRFNTFNNDWNRVDKLDTEKGLSFRRTLNAIIEANIWGYHCFCLSSF